MAWKGSADPRLRPPSWISRLAAVFLPSRLYQRVSEWDYRRLNGPRR